MAPLIGDLIFWLTIVLLSTYLLNLIFRLTSNLPPGPIGLPVVGSLLQLGGQTHEAFAKLSKQHGPLMLVWLGSRPTVVISSAELAEEALQRQNNVFSGRIIPDTATTLDYNKYSFGLSQVNPRWQELRRMSNNELFVPRRLDALKDLREEKVQVLLQHLREVCTDGRTVDIGKCAFTTTMNLMACTLFSQDLVDLHSESTGEFKSLMSALFETYSKPNLCDYFPALRWIDPQGFRRRDKKNLIRLYTLFDDLIDKHLRAYEAVAAKGEPKKKVDFLDVLLELTRDPASGFTRENIRPLLLDLFVAGSETSSTTIEWVMAELLRHPDKMAKARNELKHAVGAGSFVKESDLIHLPYLEAIMKETLRMHSPAPLLVPRRAEATTKIAGYTIPKHAQLIVNSWAISNDPTLWDEPTSFMPERFLESDVNFNGKNFKYIPFGAGKRICPGIPLASRMVLLVLASLINSFSWVLPNKMAPEDLDLKGKFRLVLQKEIPLEVIPVPLVDM